MKLLPCPFCGGLSIMRCGGGRFYVVCTDVMCFCALGEGYDRYAMSQHAFISESIAAKSWNTRTTNPEIAKLKRERDALIKERDDELAAIEKHNAAVDEMIRICENPPPPTEALVALFRDYDRTFVSDYDRGAADMRERVAKMCMAAQLTWANGELVSRIELPYDTDLSRRIRALPIKGE